MTKRRKPMKPFRGWAIVWPDGKIVVYCKAPSVYGTKRDCIQDAPDEACTARRVLITEVK